MKIVLVVVLMGGAAHADTLAPTGLQVGFRMPLDVTLGSHVGVGLAGFELDLGERVTDRWYLGATADYMLRLDVDADGTLVNRLRGGVEARYYFHEGTATLGGGASDCCCNGDPGIEVPRYDWVGARFGLQTIDEFASHQPYAELAIGTDANGGNFQLGGYLAAGLEVEPDPQIAARTLSPGDGTQLGAYFTIGMHMAFGG